MSLMRASGVAVSLALSFIVITTVASMATEHPPFDKSELDPISTGCFSCHEKPYEAPVNCCFLPFKGEGNNHIISTSYAKLAERNSGLRVGKKLPQEMILYEGKITCVTCHGNEPHNGQVTIIDNSESALCHACHRLNEVDPTVATQAKTYKY